MTVPEDELAQATGEFLSYLEAYAALIYDRDPQPIELWKEVYGKLSVPLSPHEVQIKFAGAANVAIKLARQLTKSEGRTFAEVFEQVRKDANASWDDLG